MATTTSSKEKTFMVRVVRNNEVTRGPVKTKLAPTTTIQLAAGNRRSKLTYQYTNKSWYQRTLCPQTAAKAVSTQTGTLPVLQEAREPLFQAD